MTKRIITLTLLGICLTLGLGARAATDTQTTPIKDGLVPQQSSDNKITDGITDHTVVITKFDAAEAPAITHEKITDLEMEYWRAGKTLDGKQSSLVLRLPAGQTCIKVQEWNLKLLLTIQASDGEIFHRGIPLGIDQLGDYKAGSKIQVMMVHIPKMTTIGQTAATSPVTNIKPGS